MTRTKAEVRMLSPRQHALVATLAGMTVGLAVFVSVLAIRGDGGTEAVAGTTTAPAVSTPPPAVGLPNPMQADRLRYDRRTFGSDGDVSAELPAEWDHQPQQEYQHRYVADRVGTWMIRVNPKSARQSPRELAEDRRGGASQVKDFEVVDLTDGTKPVSWNPDGLTFTTLAFTSTRKVGGEDQPRMQLSRWVSVDGGKRSAVEITVAGRPEDRSGLQGLIDHATETLKLTAKS